MKKKIPNEEKYIKMYFRIVKLILCIIILIFLMIICVVACGDKCEVFGVGLNFKTIEFSVILTLLGIFAAGAVILPKVFLRREVKECVLEEMENTVKERVERECQKYVEQKFNAVSNNQYKTDAHLSRMIAFFIRDEYPLWSIGWAFRSLKRYKELSPDKVGLTEYADFVDFLGDAVIVHSINKFVACVKRRVANNKYKAVIEELKDEADKSCEENFLRPAIRAIKDIVDFEYSVRFDKKADFNKQEILMPLCNKVADFCKILCNTIMECYGTDTKQKTSILGKPVEPEQWLTNQILQISQYGYKYTTNVNIKNDFSDKLKTEFKQIKSKNYSISPISTPTDSFFFSSPEETKSNSLLDS